ncbi:MAG TPA: PepSY-associated TM helix domain-containing protein [Noviherbaspirillum sp.]|nr:PepSY-associated TM helix domain-containing protein [Noviherbaspirillum sp.]
MKHGLRHAMDYLHTWAGALFSTVLFLVFFMGTLSVFDREIDRWMMPATRVAQPSTVSFDAVARPHLERLAPKATQWTAEYPFDRQPTMRIGWREGTELKTRHVDVNTGELLPEVGTKGGTGFFFPFHYSFHLKANDVGYWVLAVVSITMLVLLVSGVIIHKKIFADFFTFRPGKSMQRATLDLHNVSSVLLLPFHFIITLSGLIIFVFIYMKPGVLLLYGAEGAKVQQEALGQVMRKPAKEPGVLAPVDTMVVHAQELWGGGRVRNVNIRNPQDRNAVVDVLRRPHDQIGYETLTVSFDGATGEVLGRQTPSPAVKVQRFLSGLHMIPFDHWGLRWMYFLMGLVSCVMIATGLLLWVEKRRARQIKDGRSSYRVVNAIAVASTTGVLVSTLAMLVANKLLPATLPNRASAEQYVFFLAWAACLVHPLLHAFHVRHRDGATIDLRTAWREQAWLSAVLALLAVVLNFVMTGDHLLSLLSRGQLGVAGTDFVLLIIAGLSSVAAMRLGTRKGSAMSSSLATRRAAV